MRGMQRLLPVGWDKRDSRKQENKNRNEKTRTKTRENREPIKRRFQFEWKICFLWAQAYYTLELKSYLESSTIAEKKGVSNGRGLHVHEKENT